MNHLKDVVKGISWMALFRILFRSIGFIKIAILARILSPNDFGIIAISSLVLAFLEKITETGINVFLIQEKSRLEEYVDTAWVISIIRGILITVTMFLFSGPVAIFFNSGQYVWLLRYFSLIPFLRGFINPAIIKYQKELKFNREFFLRSSIIIVDFLVSLVFVLLTRSVIGLVYGLFSGVLIEIILSFIVVEPCPRLIIEKKKAQLIISRGKWVNLYGITDYLFENLDNVVVGRIMGMYFVGLYSTSYKISYLPISEVSQIFTTVTFPIYVSILNDKKKIINTFIKISLSVFILTLPFCLAILIWPKELVTIILGDKWLEIINVLRPLAIFGVIKAIIYSSYSLFLAYKKQKYITIISLVGLVGLSITIVPFVLKIGILGAGYSVLTGSILSFLVFIYFLLKILI